MEYTELNKFDPVFQTCKICNSSKIQTLITDHTGVVISICKQCKTQFMNPQYTDQFLTDLYNKYQDIDYEKKDWVSLKKRREAVHHYNLTQIEGFIDKGKFLSVGTGKGIDLEVAQKRGWAVEGQDVDNSFVDELSRKLQIEVRCGDFSEMPYPIDHFDCIYLNHVIEHPKEPGAYLKKIHELLKPNGIMYIACPNINAISTQMKRLMEKLYLKRNTGSYFATWHHLFYYSPRQFRRVLENHFNFKVLYMGNDRRAKTDNEEIKEGLLDQLTYKSSFRVIAQK